MPVDGVNSTHFAVGPVVAIVVVAALAMLSKWIFGTGRRHGARSLVPPGVQVDTGLLRPVADLPDRSAAAALWPCCPTPESAPRSAYAGTGGCRCWSSPTTRSRPASWFRPDRSRRPDRACLPPGGVRQDGGVGRYRGCIGRPRRITEPVEGLASPGGWETCPSVGGMAIHLTRIYTRTGDDGSTALGDMSRVGKTDPRVTAYGDVDEANSAIGVALALGGLAADVAVLLTTIQNDLFDVGADLCTPVVPDPEWAPLRVDESYVARLEAACDEHNEALAKLDSFVLPGGTPGAALLHTARTVARRAERSTWALLEAEPRRTNPVTATYLNRLSDLLFILARAANSPTGDVLWTPGANR